MVDKSLSILLYISVFGLRSGVEFDLLVVVLVVHSLLVSE